MLSQRLYLDFGLGYEWSQHAVASCPGTWTFVSLGNLDKPERKNLDARFGAIARPRLLPYALTADEIREQHASGKAFIDASIESTVRSACRHYLLLGDGVRPLTHVS